MNKNLDNHINALVAEIQKNENILVGSEVLPVKSILELQDKQSKLGNAWRWLTQIKDMMVQKEKQEEGEGKIVQLQ
jgi:hypothetical protein